MHFQLLCVPPLQVQFVSSLFLQVLPLLILLEQIPVLHALILHFQFVHGQKFSTILLWLALVSTAPIVSTLLSKVQVSQILNSRIQFVFVQFLTAQVVAIHFLPSLSLINPLLASLIVSAQWSLLYPSQDENLEATNNDQTVCGR